MGCNCGKRRAERLAAREAAKQLQASAAPKPTPSTGPALWKDKPKDD